MSSILLGTRARSSGTSIRFEDGSVLRLDAAPSVGTEDTAELTRHPVERGVEVADHLQPKATTMTLSGEVTATPLGASPDPLRPSRLWERLRQAQASGELLTVATSRRVYPSMALTGIRVSQDASTGGRLVAELALEHVRVAQTRTVEVDPSKVAGRNRGSWGPEQEKHHQDAAEGLIAAETARLEALRGADEAQAKARAKEENVLESQAYRDKYGKRS